MPESKAPQPKTSGPKALRRPAIQMIDSEADTLTTLALGAESRVPAVAAMLLKEIERAAIVSEKRISPDVVTMRSVVEFIDEASGADRTVQLVYPREADISAGRISILTPIGAGLIGMKTGQSILWPDRDGRERKLTIVKVSREPVPV